jgi:hypothetical protein
MGAADDRVSELLDRWLASVELHARYLALDDAAYAKVQDWPRHQRPTRWIIDLARSRCLELKRHLAERGTRGDSSFADALELMAFLTSLLGSEHVERFIPLAVEGKARPADASSAQPTSSESRPSAAPPSDPGPQPTVAPPLQRESAARRTSTPASDTVISPSHGRTERGAATRAATVKSKTAESRSGAARHATRATAAPRPARRTETPAPARRPPAPAPSRTKSGGHDATTATVIADAVRLINWGRHWPQLASLIARLADRPAEPDVWTILRAHRAEIEAQANPPPE